MRALLSSQTLAEALDHLEFEHAIYRLNPPEQGLREFVITADNWHTAGEPIIWFTASK